MTWLELGVMELIQYHFDVFDRVSRPPTEKGAISRSLTDSHARSPSSLEYRAIQQIIAGSVRNLQPMIYSIAD